MLGLPEKKATQTEQGRHTTAVKQGVYSLLNQQVKYPFYLHIVRLLSFQLL